MKVHNPSDQHPMIADLLPVESLAVENRIGAQETWIRIVRAIKNAGAHGRAGLARKVARDALLVRMQDIEAKSFRVKKRSPRFGRVVEKPGEQRRLQGHRNKGINGDRVNIARSLSRRNDANARGKFAQSRS